MGAVKDIAVVHHVRDKTRSREILVAARDPLLQPRAIEHRLAGVSIAGPFVEHENPQEVGKGHHLVEQEIGNEIVDGHARRISRIGRSEVPAGRDFRAARSELYVDPGVRREELAAEIDDRGGRDRDPQVAQEHSRNPLVHQDTAVLRVVPELDDVEMAILAFHEVRLRAPAQLTDQANGVDRHDSVGAGESSTLWLRINAEWLKTKPTRIKRTEPATRSRSK